MVNTEKTIRLRIIVSQNVFHENISLNIVVKVRNYNRPNWGWMFKECGGYISKTSDTFCFELKKNAMVSFPVATYDIEMVIVIQIHQCNTTSIFITNNDFGFAGNINQSPTCEALPNSPPSRLEEDGSIVNQLQYRRLMRAV
jgi:hypothetical protein